MDRVVVNNLNALQFGNSKKETVPIFNARS